MQIYTLNERALPLTKAKNLGLWAVQLGLAAMFVMPGLAKLSGDPQMIQVYNAIGVGQWFRYVTGIIEIGSAALLLIPALAGVGGLLLACTMIGAVLTHLFILGGSPALPLMLFVGAALVAWGRKERTLALVHK
jgi:uncharacterized membrane protein YphA (DoxX/SURF4 family)